MKDIKAREYLIPVKGNIVLDENIKIIYCDRVFDIFNNVEIHGATLNDCLEYIKRRYTLFDKNSVITVISESWLSGTVYRYNNYRDGKWYEIGRLIGFA